MACMGGRSKELQDSHVSNIWQHEVELRRAIMTVLSQFEACLNSRPLGTMPHNDDDGIEILTPGHFLIGRPILIPTSPCLSYVDGISVKLL